jgi:hypothetical protein
MDYLSSSATYLLIHLLQAISITDDYAIQVAFIIIFSMVSSLSCSIISYNCFCPCQFPRLYYWALNPLLHRVNSSLSSFYTPKIFLFSSSFWLIHYYDMHLSPVSSFDSPLFYACHPLSNNPFSAVKLFYLEFLGLEHKFVRFLTLPNNLFFT